MNRLSARALPLTLALGLAAVGCIEETEEAPALDDMGGVAADGAVDAPDQGGPAPDMMPAPDMAPPPASCGNEDDLFPNQDLASAAPIEVGFARQDLFICPDTEDVFAVPLAANEGITVTLLADPAETDLDLSILDADGMVVGDSAGETGEEQLRFTAPADGTYYVKVNGYRGQATFYALSVAGGCAVDAQCPEGQVCARGEGVCEPFEVPQCGADVNEPNDRDDQATPVGVPGEIRGTLCEGDRDWFEFEAADGDTVDILLGFPAQQDLDLAVTDLRTGAFLAFAQGDARVNPERVQLPSLPAGRYGVVVFGGDGARDVEFSLQLAGRSDACAADRDCSNGLPICDAGVCRAVNQADPVALGGRCDDQADCGPDAEFCYTGGPGGHDNVCTVQCRGDNDCAGLGQGATCVPVSRQAAVCFPPCQSDDDCSAFRTCQNNTCELRGECRGDGDCGEGEACEITQFGRFCVLAGEAPACGADPAPYTDNDRLAMAAEVPADGTEIEGLQICDEDRDYFRFEVPAEAAAYTLEVAASFREGVDIDVYVYDAAGNLVAEATSPDQTTEVATARYIAPGSYTVFIDQFSSDRLEDTAYSLSVGVVDNDDACTVEGNECGATQPLRSECVAETGACQALDGQGQVALGGRCDSDDDCVEAALLCWVFEGGADGYNVCTIPCQGDGDCADAPGTVCTQFRGGAVCLPPRD